MFATRAADSAESGDQALHPGRDEVADDASPGLSMRWLRVGRGQDPHPAELHFESNRTHLQDGD